MSYEIPQTFGDNECFVIPRVYLQFDPAGTPNNEEFSLTFPTSDIHGTKRLAERLSFMPFPKHAPVDTLSLDDINTDGAALHTIEDGDVIRVNFGFNPLPKVERAEMPTNFIEAQRYMTTLRAPIIEGWNTVFTRVLELTNIQYQYGVPESKYDPALPPAPARWSYRRGKNTHEPRIVISHSLDETITALGDDGKTASRLTSEAEDYIVQLHLAERESHFSPIDNCKIGLYGKLISNAISSIGQMDGHLTEQDIRRDHTEQDYRLQTGDAYIAHGHNISDIGNPKWLAMLAVGILSRETLARQRQSDDSADLMSS